MFNWSCISSNAVVDHEHNDALISAFIIQLNDEKWPTQQAAISNLRRLAANERNKSIIGTAGGIAPILQLLNHNSPQVKLDAIATLSMLVTNIDNKLTVAQLDGYKLLLSLVRNCENINVRIFAAKTIGNLALDHPASQKAIITTENGIALLVKHLNDIFDTSSELNENLIKAIGQLATNAQNAEAIAAVVKIDATVELLRDQNRPNQAEVSKNSAALIWKLAISPRNAAEIAAAGGIAYLAALLGDNVEIQIRVLAALGQLAYIHEPNRQLISDHLGRSGIRFIVQSLKSRRPEMRKYAARILWNIALCSDSNKIYNNNQDRIESEGAINPLMRMLKDPDAEARQNAVGALCQLSMNNDRNKNVIIEAGGVKMLIQLLSDKNTKVQEIAAKTLANLSTGYNEIKSHVKNAKGIPPLLLQLNQNNVVLKNEVARALSRLSSDEGIGMAIMRADGITSLTRLMADKENSVGRKHAFLVLYNLANPSNRFTHADDATFELKSNVTAGVARAIVTAEGVVSLVALLSEEDQTCYYPSSFACDLLERISKLGNYVDPIREAGAIPLLIKMLNEKKVGTLSNLKVLHYLSQDEYGQFLAVNAGVLPALIRLLEHTINHERSNFVDMHANLITQLLRNVINLSSSCLLVARSSVMPLLRQLQSLKISKETRAVTEEILNLCAQAIQKNSTVTFKNNFIERANSLLSSGYKFSVQRVNESIQISCLEAPFNTKEDMANSLLAQASGSLTGNLSDVDQTGGKRNLILYMSSPLQATGLFNELKKLQPSKMLTTKETKDNFQCAVS